MIVSIDALEAFDKIQHPFMIKTLRKLCQYYKAIYEKTHNVILNGEKLKAFPLSGTRQGRLLSPLLFNTILEVLARVIRQEKEIKGIQIGKEEVKLALFTDDMILYVENPKDYTNITHTHTVRMNNSAKLQDTKINMQISVAFLYMNSKQSKKEIKKAIQFIIASKRIKYLGINKGGEKLSAKMLLKEIKEDINGKKFCVHGLKDLIFLRCQYYLKLNLQIQCNLSKLLDLFCRNRKTHSKIHMASQGTLDSQNNFEKEEKSQRSHTS